MHFNVSRLFIIFIGIFLAAALYWPETHESHATEAFATGTVEIISGANRHKFVTEIASSAAQRSQGLMGRKSLPLNTGMLFIFEKTGPIKMWMKNTYISLDMIFVSDNGQIINIAAKTEPHSTRILSSNGPAKMVLEVRGGTASRLNINVGDRLVVGR
jgi:uncharacterized protein